MDAAALADFAAQLSRKWMGGKDHPQTRRHHFNLNSPRQLGEVLFDVLKLGDKPKKTKTGQYATDEQTLLALAAEHEIVQRLLGLPRRHQAQVHLRRRAAQDDLPETGRVHTTFNQAITTTGRLHSQNPNLQNIPIRTEHGREIRKAFVPRDADYLPALRRLFADRAAHHGRAQPRPAMREAFKQGDDIHTATAARVFGVQLEQVTPEMRRKAKMVNFGIIYGISAFGLAQRLGIPRTEAGEIIDQYFAPISRRQALHGPTPSPSPRSMATSKP